MVVIAHGDAAGGEHHICFQGLAQGLQQALPVVGDPLEGQRRGPTGPHLGAEGVDVGVPDAARAGLLADIHQFVAGGEHRYAQAPVHGQLRDARRRQGPEIPGPQAVARPQQELTFPQVLSGVPDVQARSLGLVQFHPGLPSSIAPRGLLHGHHGVRSLRQRCAGHDAQGLAGAHGLPGRIARGKITKHTQA